MWTSTPSYQRHSEAVVGCCFQRAHPKSLGGFGELAGKLWGQMRWWRRIGHLAPELTGELAEAAERLGMSALEAAAYDRLAVPLV